MKPVCESLILCERVLIDAHLGNVTAISCIDQIRALQLPAVHHGFAFTARFQWEGTLPTENVPVRYRLCRSSEADGEEEVATLDGVWQKGSRWSRYSQNFGVLRLRRPERVTFRVDHSVKGEPWVRGASAGIDIGLMEMPDEQREALLAQIKALGVTPT